MRRLVSLAVALSVLTPAAPGWAADPAVRNPGDPTYVIWLRGSATGIDWKGSQSISFANHEEDPISSIWLRLWSNGVKGCGHRAIVVTDVRGGTAAGLSRNCTALRIDLDTPVAQGEEARISMHVRIHLPKRNDRFGHHAGLSLVGTALPTLAVHDEEGWHLDPYVDLGESFYSVTGTYRVTLDVPTRLRTPTTGVAVSSQTERNRRVTTYEARHVRDFEWAAGKLASVRGHVGATQVLVSYRPRDITRKQALTALEYSIQSLRSFSAAFGVFPYPEMDVVLTGFTMFSGMEYPTIIFTNAQKITIAHEIAHQYWYGIVGDDQFSSPWLDESFATWSSYLPFGGWKKCASYRWPSAGARITNDMAYWATHPAEYDTVYTGGGCMLANLADLFGLERFVGVLHDYAQAHLFDITRTEDFKAAVEAAAVEDGLAFDPLEYWARWRVD